MSSKRHKEGGLGPRLDKLESFLHEAFNWSDPSVIPELQKMMGRNKASASPINKATGKFGKKPTIKKPSSKEPARPKYVVDTSEKPQDPGRPNELIIKRNEDEQKRLLKMKNNPVTVKVHSKFHNTGDIITTEKKRSVKSEIPNYDPFNKNSSISEQQPLAIVYN